MSHLENGAGATTQVCASATAEECAQLRQENEAWQSQVEELQQQLASANQIAEDRWVELQKEYEALIEEKSEMIRALHHKNAELRDRVANHVPAPAHAPIDAPPPDREELLHLQKEVQDQRRQMEEDEEAMMSQMRQMEMALAKDRAELARQRAELQRLNDDLKHELEVTAREGGLRERLGALQRSVNQAAAPRAPFKRDVAPSGQQPKPAASVGNQNKSGLFRRIFGATK